ncbi:MAG TPA: hypothetical protein VK464_21730 [Symbiobacteriaceae bacterium]|nr:hypothetical protein [Symbiobacteriaceae bacterium]
MQTWKATLFSLLGTGLVASLVAWVGALLWALIQHGRVDLPSLMDPMFILTMVFLVPGAGFLVATMNRRPPQPGAPEPTRQAPPANLWERVARVGLGWYLVVAGILCMAELFLVDYLAR